MSSASATQRTSASRSPVRATPRIRSNSGAVGLFSYGEGFLGALGTGSYDDVAEPSRLPATRELNVKQLSAGW